jgi:hypothetical protein
MLHIGKKIRQVLSDQKMPVQNFAYAISRSRTVVYDIFERETIDTGLLLKISEVLGYDFFRLYSPRVVLNTPSLANESAAEYETKTKDKITELEKEIAYLKEINDLLRKSK